MKSEDDLLHAIEEHDYWTETGASVQDAKKAVIYTVETDNTGSRNDWRNYVSDVAWDLWADLPLSTKMLLYIDAQSGVNLAWTGYDNE